MGLEIITDHIGLWAFLLIGGFIVWKFIIQPQMNAGKPIDPPDGELESPES